MPSKKTDPAKQLTAILEQIKALDETQADAQLNIAAMLHAIKTNKLYMIGGYNSFAMMVRGELDFSPGHATAYIGLYEAFTHWKYNRYEFLKLIRQFGWRRVERSISYAGRKLTYRTMKATIAELTGTNKGNQPQVNFTCRDTQMLERIESALMTHGLQYTKSGRRINASEALISLINDYELLQKTVGKATPKKATRADSRAA